MPYDAALITKLLRKMPADQLAAVGPHDFQRWPVAVETPAKAIRELISNEKARRK